jgi:hypothetical protein
MRGAGTLSERLGTIGIQVAPEAQQLIVPQQQLERRELLLDEVDETRPRAPLHQDRGVPQVMLARECEAMVDQRQFGTRLLEQHVGAAPVLVVDECVEERRS